ncbi:VanZ family protein [Spiribacter halobius]|uniref:VanZ-like domain-containing protein n=1 Tax=Sediminicurvatus halobius TaxID=2182432 RepID=A0A2U2MX76_9GAMM|nr:VanZ family protein [Spiribacter halobius]PWG61460.1 hypothetical protein DEM34_16305 [Spiribacter halobius]UEX77245.1 VanZ family protein [Spiribacter halobius]
MVTTAAERAIPATGPTTGRRLWPWITAYLAGLAYVSFIPFRYRGLPAEIWWQRALELRWLDLGLGSRADWIANLVLFVPFGMLLVAALARRHRHPGPIAALGALFAVLLTALAIEVVQPQFSPRTASLNDILAALLGGGLGISLWIGAGPRILASLRAAAHPGLPGITAGLGVYTAGYLLFSLFPFDFITSADELSRRLATRPPALLISGCEDEARCAARLLLETLTVLPIGAWLALRARLHGRALGTAPVFLAGLALGVCLETLQIFIFHGVSQGASIVARGVGSAAGALALTHALSTPPERLRRQLRTLALAGIIPYAIGLPLLNGLTGSSRLPVNEALARLSEVSFLPFYYHYFTSEAEAMQSLVYHLGLYAPIGAALWTWGRGAATAGIAATVAALIALVMETGKLLVAELHPDPTNLLIAAVGAVLAHAVLERGFTALSARSPPLPAGPPSRVPAAAAESAGRPPGDSVAVSTSVWQQAPRSGRRIRRGARRHAPARPKRPSRYRARAVALLLGPTALAAALFWPMAGLLLVIGLIAYAAWLYRDPGAWLLAVPVAVPLLNFAPYTGRYFVSELDLLLAVTLAVGLWRRPPAAHGLHLPRLAATAAGLFAVSWVISLATGLWPLPPLDANAFATYDSPMNALRVGKGFAWGVALYLLARRLPSAEAERVGHRFTAGMTAGLAAVVAVVLWERNAYPGLLDFDSGYRVTALFADMHVGGPTIEAFLVLTLPFALLWTWQARHLITFLCGLTLLAGAAYAVLVTYSRAGYLGAALAAAATLAGLAWLAWRDGDRLRAIGSLAALVLLPLLAAGVQGGMGSYLDYRLTRLEADLEGRLERWQHALRLAEAGALEATLGHGLGAYPRLHVADRLAREERLPVNFAHSAEPGDGLLRLSPSQPSFVAQRVAAMPGSRLTVELQVRPVLAEWGALAVVLCETHRMEWVRCEWQRLRVEGEPGVWQQHELSIQAGDLGAGPWFAQRGLAFGIAHFGGEGIIEIERAALLDDGHDLLSNGSFTDGLERWYHTTSRHEAWRAENQWLEFYIDQGLLGATTFTLFILAAAAALARRSVAGSPVALAVLAALAGLLVIAVFATVFWSPRIAMLFWLVAFLGMARGRVERGGGDGVMGRRPRAARFTRRHRPAKAGFSGHTAASTSDADLITPSPRTHPSPTPQSHRIRYASSQRERRQEHHAHPHNRRGRLHWIGRHPPSDPRNRA